MALILVVLDGAIANVALPSIAASLNADASHTVWVVSSYQLAVLVALLPCGALGEIFGARRVYLAGVVLFVLASAGCTFAGSLPVLVAARFVQGLGGGAIMALAAMNLRLAVPQRMLGTIIGFNAVTVAASSAAGPAVAGAILSVAHWSWLFAVNIPLGLVILAGGRALHARPGSRKRIDALTLLLNTAMFVLLFWGADRIAEAPLQSAALIAAALACLGAILARERGNPAPIVPTDLLASPAFRIAVIASVMCFAGQMLSYVALPFYLQHTLGMSPGLAGLYMMPWPIATVIMAPISGRLSDRMGTAWLCTCGGTLFAAGLLAVALLPADPWHLVFLLGTVAAGAGFGTFQTPNNHILLLSAPKHRSGAAGAMQGTARLTGQTLGAISMSVIFQTVALGPAPKIALFIAGLCAVAAALASFTRLRFDRTAVPDSGE
nr:MFS transporter [Ancylobacter crimeensis]